MWRVLLVGPGIANPLDSLSSVLLVGPGITNPLDSLSSAP
jgi:hypothetical protein